MSSPASVPSWSNSSPPPAAAAHALILRDGEIRARGVLRQMRDFACDFVAEGAYTLSDRTPEGCCLLIAGAAAPVAIQSIRHRVDGHFMLVLGEKPIAA